jgi:hypothetical protein
MLHILPQHRPNFRIVGRLQGPIFEPCIALRNDKNVISPDLSFKLCLVLSSTYIYLEGPAAGQQWSMSVEKAHEKLFYELEIFGPVKLSHQQDPSTPPTVGMLYLRTDESPAIDAA